MVHFRQHTWLLDDPFRGDDALGVSQQFVACYELAHLSRAQNLDKKKCVCGCYSGRGGPSRKRLAQDVHQLDLIDYAWGIVQCVRQTERCYDFAGLLRPAPKRHNWQASHASWPGSYWYSLANGCLKAQQPASAAA